MKVTLTQHPEVAIIQVLHLIRETREVAASYEHPGPCLNEKSALEVRNAARLITLNHIEEILSGEFDAMLNLEAR